MPSLSDRGCCHRGPVVSLPPLSLLGGAPPNPDGNEDSNNKNKDEDKDKDDDNDDNNYCS